MRWAALPRLFLLGPLALLACAPAGQSGAFPRPSLNVTVTPDDLRFTLSGRDLPAGRPVTATLFGPAGPGVTRARTGAGQVTLRVPFVRAGVTPYEVRVGPHLFTGEVRRAPGVPVSPLTLKVGGRAVRVTRPRPPALVLHPTDRHGNVTAWPVRVRVERPDGVVWNRVVPVSHLGAWTFLPPGRVTGLMTVTAVTGGAAGESGEVDLLPGPLERFTALRAAGGVRLSALRDALGNRVVDQEAAQLTGQEDGWNVQVPVTVVSGGAAPPWPLRSARLEAEQVGAPRR
ncbi:hypothetical protein [Deinococcus depolymerans]|uniref:Carboxypeptidase regulatory-like domain-containing protein n=1 Tax=Deinococcus depolymerans TaxID=392408 RepID=A0ABN1BNY0_9DEIO